MPTIKPGSIFQAELRKDSDPVYTRMLAEIRESLGSGELQVGDRLPSERTLSDAYKISVNSVRRGIDELIAAGLVERRHGSGTYVTSVVTPRTEPVQRDTIGILFDKEVAGYHPYFSEKRRGITERLTQLGWRIWHPPTPTVPVNGNGDGLVNTDRATRTRELLSHPELAGGVLSSGHAEEMLAHNRTDFPFVVPNGHHTYPFVAYNGTDDTLRALRCVCRSGARRILLVQTPSTLPPAQLAAGVAALETGIEAPELVPVSVPSHSIFTKCIRDAFTVTRQALAENRDLDGIVFGSDFVAQGGMDALAETNGTGQPSLHLACLLNEKSQLRTSFRYTAVVGDGYLQGRRIAELLHQRILTPTDAPHHIWLHSEVREYDS